MMFCHYVTTAVNVRRFVCGSLVNMVRLAAGARCDVANVRSIFQSKARMLARSGSVVSKKGPYHYASFT